MRYTLSTTYCHTGNPVTTPHHPCWRGLLAGVLLSVAPAWILAAPDRLEKEARALQSEWADIFYKAPRSQQAGLYKALLTRIRALKDQHPERAEPMIVEAITLCTYSGSALGLDTLDVLEQARELLQKAIDLNPPALDGAAYMTLGNLYRRLPGWPVLYGDKALARQYFEHAVKLYPDAIDSNYFLGEFLLDQGDYDGALPYLEKSSRAPIRPSLRVSDEKLREENAEAMANARDHKPSPSDFFGLFTPSFGQDKKKQ